MSVCVVCLFVLELESLALFLSTSSLSSDSLVFCFRFRSLCLSLWEWTVTWRDWRLSDIMFSILMLMYRWMENNATRFAFHSVGQRILLCAAQIHHRLILHIIFIVNSINNGSVGQTMKRLCGSPLFQSRRLSTTCLFFSFFVYSKYSNELCRKNKIWNTNRSETTKFGIF